MQVGNCEIMRPGREPCCLQEDYFTTALWSEGMPVLHALGTNGMYGR